MLKKILRRLIGLFFFINPVTRHKIKNSLIIYNFHDVSNNKTDFLKKNNLVVSPDIFKKQIKWIKKFHKIISPKEMLSIKNFDSFNAMITFDDGFYGTFKNGLPILRNEKISSLIFLNMHNILNNEPLISAITDYLENNDVNYKKFLINKNLKKPSHLTLTPKYLDEFIKKYGPINMSKIYKYQGEFAQISLLMKSEKNPYVFYGNHLYEHWNAISLTKKELEYQYKKNNQYLKSFQSSIDFLAFPNGKFGSCFDKQQISILDDISSIKYFASNSFYNKQPYQKVFGRLTLIESDTSILDFWYRIGRFCHR